MSPAPHLVLIGISDQAEKPANIFRRPVEVLTAAILERSSMHTQVCQTRIADINRCTKSSPESIELP